MKVLKFGGSSVASSQSLEKVAKICIDKSVKDQIVVVVSALGAMTDLLHSCALNASNGEEKYSEYLQDIENRHLTLIKEIIPINDRSSVLAQFKRDSNELEDVLKGIFYLRELSNKSLAKVLSFGEIFSSKIVHAYIKSKEKDTLLLNSFELFKGNSDYLNSVIDFQQSEKLILGSLNENFKIAVAAGFIGSNKKNETITFGRGGSDFSASIIASLANAEVLEIWTDVDGILSADPRLVSQAKTLNEVSYDEALELSHFGAKVIYPPSILPALNKGIKMLIKNTFNPSAEGTLVSKNSSSKKEITGISAIDNISLIDVRGAGMIAKPGFAARTFKVLSDNDINVILITQASSEHSICFAVKHQDAKNALNKLAKEFKYELQNGELDDFSVEQDLSIVAIVGDNMKSKSGVSGRTFSSLGNNGINIRAIAQGSSEKNISLVVSNRNLKKAINVLHEEFFLGDFKKIHLYLAGLGNVGKSLIEQIKSQSSALLKNQKLELKVIAIANSRLQLIDEKGIDLNNWEADLKAQGTKLNLEELRVRASELNLRNSVFIDNTASYEVAATYLDFIKSKISVICSNKIAASDEFSNYETLKKSAVENRVDFLNEANVGAGLPVIDTISKLIDSGDKITEIQGVLSGSLSFIFDNYYGDKSFVEIVKKAKELAYTEPDPRIDLSGVDVARKILILAREAGLEMNLGDIEIVDFLPKSCINTNSVDEFLTNLKKEEDFFKDLVEKANSKNEILKIVASFKNGKAKVSLENISEKHPFYRLNGTDNMLMIYTERYSTLPMIIQGAGAGADVTAAGVFGDILRTVRR